MVRRRTNRTLERRSAPDWVPHFLTTLAETSNIRAACEAAAVARSTVYLHRDNDPEFAAAMTAALDDACDALELEARRRAHRGVDEPVVYQGEVMGIWVDEQGNRVTETTPGARHVPLTIKRYSDTLMIFLLKAHRPEKYRERFDHEHSGKGGGPVPVSFVEVPSDAINRGSGEGA